MSRKDTPNDPPAPARPAQAEEPPVVEYPKMLYHADGRTTTVQNADEEKAAKQDGYEETPVSPEAPRGKRAG